MRSSRLFLVGVAVALGCAASPPDGFGPIAGASAAGGATGRGGIGRPAPRHRPLRKSPPGPLPELRRSRDTLRTRASEDGGRLVLLSRDGSSRILTPDFESAADPAVSFDGERILFAAKRRAFDRWDIYEMKADGAGVRRITHDLGDCRSPIYQSPIFYLDDPGPMPQIAFVSNAPAEYGEYGAAPATALYSARLDGSKVRRLTYNPSGAFDPTMLPDGRMLFSAWRSPGPGPVARARVELLGINIDGSDYAAFSGAQGSRMKLMACVTARRQVVFVGHRPTRRRRRRPAGDNRSAPEPAFLQTAHTAG